MGGSVERHIGDDDRDGAATPQPAGEAVPVALTYSQKLEALSLRFYQGMTWNPKAGDYYTTSRADLELYRVVEVEDGTVKTQYCDQRNTDAVASWPVEEFTSAGFGPKRVWVPDFVLSAHPPQPSDTVAEVRALAFIEAARFIEEMEQVDPPEPMSADMLKAVAGAGLREMAKRIAALKGEDEMTDTRELVELVRAALANGGRG